MPAANGTRPTGPMPPPVPVLLYHAVTADPPGWIARFAVTPAVFGAHLDAVLASGRQPLTVSEYTDGLNGKVPLPPRPVLITVDDGFADFADNALPALTERRLPSTLYVTTGACAGRPRETVLPDAEMLSYADLPGLEAAGVEIGAHSHTHRQLDLLSAREAAADVAASRDLLAQALGHRVRSFAYPHGYWRPRVRRLVGDAGFDSACAVGNAWSSAGDHRLAMSRLMVRADHDLATVASWLDGPGGHVLPARQRALAFGWRQYRRAMQLRGKGEWQA